MISNKWIWLIAIIFFIKALILSFWITPLWDIPDEPGHFAYARDIGSGKGIPVLGKSVIETDIRSHVAGSVVTSTKINWIAQHPPAYYIPAGLLWKVAAFFTADPEILFRVPRVLSALSGALVIIVLYFLLVLVSGNRLASLGFAASIGFIPMFSHMSSGTNQDITLTLFVCLATYYWTRFLIQKKNVKYACYTAIWLSVACFTKLTALVLTAPMLFIMFFELESSWKLRIKQAAIIFGIWFILPGLWMIRSYYYFGKFFVTAAGQRGFSLDSNPLTDSFFYYLGKQQAIEQFFVNFFGLFGFIGTGKGNLCWLPVGSWPLTVYSMFVMLLLLMVLLYLSYVVIWGNEKYIEKSNSVFDFISRYTSFFTARMGIRLTIVCYGMIIAIVTWLIPTDSIFRHIAFSTLNYIWVLSLFLILCTLEQKQRLVVYAWIIIFFFIVILLRQVYHFFILGGELRATHGRYLYPLIPLIMVGIIGPAFALFKKQAAHLFILLALVMAFTEMNVFLSQVIPFYSNFNLKFHVDFIGRIFFIMLYAIFSLIILFVWASQMIKKPLSHPRS